MASVEQREATHPAGLTSLELFDKFKVLDEDKDSDEESFHLPMLDSEEDISSNKASSDTPIQNGESEDDILNKFDCVTTPEPLDPKAEESILNEDVEEENVDSKIVSSENEEKKVEITQNGLEEGNTIDEIKTDIPKNDEETEEKDIVDNKVGDTEVNDQPEDVSEEVEEKVTKDKEEDKLPEKTQDDNMEVDDEAAAAINEPTEDTKIAVTEETKEEGDKKEDLEEDVKENEKNMDIDTEITSEITNEDKKDDQNKEQEMEIDDVIADDTSKESTHTESKADVTSKESTHTETKADDTSKESTNTESKADDTSKESTHTNVEEITSGQTPSDKEEAEEDKKEVLQSEKTEDIQDKTEEEPTSDVQMTETANLSDVEPQEITSESAIEEDEEAKKADDTIVEIKDDVITTEKQSTETDKISSAQEVEEEPNVVDDTSKVVKDDLKKTDEPESDKKTENEANDSANSENLERDDLLDISVICDVDEDNAKAVADNASDGQTSEKSDNDEQDDKGDNEESENDQEENTCSSDKDDAMEFDDSVSNSNSNLPFEENSSTNDNVPVSNVNEKSDSMDSSDSGASKEDVEMVDVLPKVIAGLSASSSTKKSLTEAKSQTTEEKTENGVETGANVPEEPVEYLDLDKHMAEQKKILDVSTPSGKRPLPQDDEKNVTTKKMRLSDSPIKDDTTTKKTQGDDKLKKLTSFESFMRTKIFNKKLTKSDLEQFCIQKICEVIMHKTELGELNQLVKKQEQVHEQLRRDIQQLTKQNRDLDIVNKKLMNELKTQNGKQKPLVPLKITRSVGLQVKLNVSTEPTRKRPPTTPIRTTPPVSNNTTPVNNPRPRTVPQTSNVVRQVTPNNTASPRKPPQASGSTTPILSQALQTPAGRQSTTPTNAPKRPPIIRPKPAPESTNKPSNPGVIDLTDEDDRTPKTPGGANIKIVNKQMVTTSKLVNQKPVGKSPNNQAKMVNINQVKSGQVVNKGTPNRTVTTLPQGVRLTSTTTVKNGIAIPVTSTTGGPQLMYVVQPSSQLVTTTAQGGQKTVLLNFQPGNGILTSALNGSAVSVIPTKANVQVKTAPTTRKHPAPLPLPPPMQPNANLKPLLPKPHLSIRKTETGIILQWRMPYNLDIYESIASYQLFAYQETNAPPSTDMWRKVGDVKALALPMACTLTQFADKNKYYFAVRSVDVHKRIGAFSEPEEISL